MTTQAKTAQQTKRTDYPTPIDANLSRSALQIKASCRDCIHFKKMAYPAYKQVCSEIGIIEDSKPCENFAPDPSAVKFSESKRVRQLAAALQELSPREKRLLAIMFNQEDRTNKQNFFFGEIIYFKLYGGEYLKNYVKARVVWADRRYVHIQGVDGCMASLLHNSVFKEHRWNKKEMWFLKNNKITDPDLSRYERVPSRMQMELQKIEKPLPLDFSGELANKGVLAKTSAKNTAKPRVNTILPRALDRQQNDMLVR